MTALKLSISPGELTSRLQDRLRGGSKTPRVVWQMDDGQRLMLYVDTLNAQLRDGWLIASMDVFTDQTSRQVLQFIFCLGKVGEGNGAQAACTINAASPGATQIAAVWGTELQRVLWDAVLDGLEAAMYRAGALKPGLALRLKGFYCDTAGFHTEVLAGEL